MKRKILGSIFRGELIFQDGKHQTEEMNPALEIILQKTSELQKEETGNAFISENASRNVREVGLEPTQVASLPPQSSASAIPPLPHVRGNYLTEPLQRNQVHHTLFDRKIFPT